MIRVQSILGRDTADTAPARRREWLWLDSDEATRPRQLRVTDAGTEIGLDLPRGTFLPDGAVLHDDGTRRVVVRRRPERALELALEDGIGDAQLLSLAARLGHALGNRHWPMEVVGRAVRVPVAAGGEALVERTLRELALPGVRLRVADLPLALERPLSGSGHHHH